jgi:hypothetical protein
VTSAASQPAGVSAAPAGVALALLGLVYPLRRLLPRPARTPAKRQRPNRPRRE